MERCSAPACAHSGRRLPPGGDRIAFYLVDRIVAYEPFRWVRAVSTARGGDHFLREGPDGPEVDPMMALEALGQAGDFLMLLSTGMKQRGALITIGRLEAVAPIRPGETLELDGTTTNVSDEFWAMSGRVSVAGRPAVVVSDLMAILVDAAELEQAGSVERRLQDVLSK